MHGIGAGGELYQSSMPIERMYEMVKYGPIRLIGLYIFARILTP